MANERYIQTEYPYPLMDPTASPFIQYPSPSPHVLMTTPQPSYAASSYSLPMVPQHLLDYNAQLANIVLGHLSRGNGGGGGGRGQAAPAQGQAAPAQAAPGQGQMAPAHTPFQEAQNAFVGPPEPRQPTQYIWSAPTDTWGNYLTFQAQNLNPIELYQRALGRPFRDFVYPWLRDEAIPGAGSTLYNAFIAPWSR